MQRLAVAALDIEGAGAHAVDAHDDRDALALLVHVLLDLEHALPDRIALVARVDDARFAVEADGSTILRWIADERRNTAIPAEVCERLAFRALPPRQMVLVPDHQAAAQRQVRLAVAGRGDECGGQPLFVVDARGVHDLRELREVDRGDGRTWGRPGWWHRSHRGDANTDAPAFTSRCAVCAAHRVSARIVVWR